MYVYATTNTNSEFPQTHRPSETAFLLVDEYVISFSTSSQSLEGAKSQVSFGSKKFGPRKLLPRTSLEKVEDFFQVG